MEGPETELGRAKAGLRLAFGDAAEAVTPATAFPVLASPGWHGVDGLHYRATVAGQGCHIKVLHTDAAFYADAAVAVAAARAAAQLGIGPDVLAADAGLGVLVTADVSGERQVGTLDRIDPADVRASIIAARKAFQAGAPKLGRPVDAFADVVALAAKAAEVGARVPQDIDWLLASVAEAAAAVSACGRDSVPAHGDGNASNVLVGKDGSVLLVDWDRAGDMDPFEDLGSLIVEMAAQEPEARAIFEAWHGSMDEGLFARTQLYGIADDLRWGLIAAILAATSPRTTLEFLKFANWRFLRCRMALRDPRYSERLRRVR
ncbi:MAG: phosphotransferase [Geminicoccaceae bacterium]